LHGGGMALVKKSASARSIARFFRLPILSKRRRHTDPTAQAGSRASISLFS